MGAGKAATFDRHRKDQTFSTAEGEARHRQAPVFLIQCAQSGQIREG